MHKSIPGIFLALMLLPIQYGFSAEVTDTEQTLTVTLSGDSQFVYRDADGYTIVIGQVINNSSTPVTNVRIVADFFDDVNLHPVESNTGDVILEVIPTAGSSPYMIKSKTANPVITQASVHLDGFEPSSSKLKQLTVGGYNMAYVDQMLYFSGFLKNGVAAPISDTNVYAAFYDGFEPPRIIGIHLVDLGSILPNERVPFDFSEKINSKAAGFYLFAESSAFGSEFVDIQIPVAEDLTKLVTIKDVVVTDMHGNELYDISVGSTVQVAVESWIQTAYSLSDTTPYIYFVQIKQIGTIPHVEFLGQYNGTYKNGEPHLASVNWVAENTGEFFIETYVWDRNHAAIAEKGPLVLISVK